MLLRNKLIVISIFLLWTYFLYAYFFYFKPAPFNLHKTTFSQLPSWQLDDQSSAFFALKNSCVEILKREPSLPAKLSEAVKDIGLWQPVCLAANKLTHPDTVTARNFFENWFDLFQIKNFRSTQGLFTGYYLPTLNANLSKTAIYQFPIYGMPRDLVKVNINYFRPDTLGKPLIGYINNNVLLPYPDREQITKGAINNRAPIIAWGDNELDIFFAQIQGSALINLPDHHQILIGYAGDNGHVYFPIGKFLLNKNALNKNNISMQSIREWLDNHPEEREGVLNQNRSYVFFQVLKSDEPIGSQGVPLTSMRSLAVDTNYIPLGAPVWLETQLGPVNNSTKLNALLLQKKNFLFQHLLIAQDTGGAIKGTIRGDIYCGKGSEAEFIAGHLRASGKLWILLPKKI